MDTTLIANLENTPAVWGYLAQQSIYDNPSSPLYQAQLVDNSYSSLQVRTPMVIEFYSSKDPSTQQCNVKTVQLYINPNKLNISTQKVKDKKYTRGGIFYHHWGDDVWSMSLSGVLGYAGMSGIKQLEDIYHASGTLLRYQDYGPTVYGGNPGSFLNQVDFSNPLAGFQYVFNNNNIPTSTISQIQQTYQNMASPSLAGGLSSTFTTQSLNSLGATLIGNYQNLTQTAQSANNFGNVYRDSNQYYSNNVSNGNFLNFGNVYQYTKQSVGQAFPTTHPDLQNTIAYDATRAVMASVNSNSNSVTTLEQSASSQNTFQHLDTLYSAISGSSSQTNFLPTNLFSSSLFEFGQMSGLALQGSIMTAQAISNSRTVTRQSVQGGWADIQDELSDEWRPRQIWIYFENRVYIGHFDSFTYARVAEHPLIQYDMKFTVTRQIELTTNDSSAIAPFVSAGASLIGSMLQSTMPNPTSQITPTQAKISYYLTNTDQAINDAKFDILNSKNQLVFETETATMSSSTISPDRVNQIQSWISQVQQSINIDPTDLVFGNNTMTDDQRIDFFALGNSNPQIAVNTNTGIIIQIIGNGGIVIPGISIQPFQNGISASPIVITNAEGNAQFYLAAGTYVFQMIATDNITQSSAQTIINNKMINISIQMDVSPPIATGTIKIIVNNTNQELLSGAQVNGTIQNPPAGISNTTISQIADNNGECLFSNIPQGIYIFTVTYINNTTVMTSVTQNVTSSNSDLTVTLNIDKVILTGSITIIVVDSQNNSQFIQGAIVQAIQNSQIISTSLATDNNGQCTLNGLPYGDYIFNVIFNNITNSSSLTLINQPISANLSILFNQLVQEGNISIKITQNGNGIQGIIVEADLNNISQGRNTSDQTGYCVFNNLVPGTYVFNVISADYISTPITVNINTGTNSLVEIPITAPSNPGMLSVNVLDQNSNLGLSGTIIKVMLNNQVIQTSTTTTNGNCQLTLSPNNYSVIATYNVDSSPYTISIVSGQTSTLNIPIDISSLYGSIQVSIQDNATNNVNTANVSISPIGKGSLIQSSVKMGSGIYLIRYVPAGNYILTTTCQSYTTINNIQITQNAQTPVSILIPFNTVTYGNIIVTTSGNKNNIVLPNSIIIQVYDSTNTIQSQYTGNSIVIDNKNVQTNTINLSVGSYNFVIAGNHGSIQASIQENITTNITIDYQ